MSFPLDLEAFKRFNRLISFDTTTFFRSLTIDNRYRLETFKYRGVTFIKTYHGYYISKSVDMSLKQWYRKITKTQYYYIKELKKQEQKKCESAKNSVKKRILSLFPELD